MRLLYTVCFYLLLPLIVLRLLWRSCRAPEYKKRWSERFGQFYLPTKYQGAIWVHAVSVGETMAAIPLIRSLRVRYPTIPIVITTMTPTGSQQVRAQLGDDVFHVYAPYDVPFAVNSFFARVQPRLFILMETELWPNILAGCQARNIPVLLANARLSKRSYRGYCKIGFFIKPLLQALTAVAAQTEMDAKHFQGLGVPDAAIEVTGSVKFDMEIPEQLLLDAAALRKSWGCQQRPIWIAASTHDGEDEKVLAAFASVRKTLDNSLLILVPRHPERFSQVATLSRQKGFQTVLRSKNEPCTAHTAVYIGDTMGDLLLLFAMADVAFVGGSLVATGGHNVLEPAALGLVTITGPHVFNFSKICQLLTDADALLTVNNTRDLTMGVLDLLQHTEKRQAMGRRAQAIVAKNRGSVDKHLAILSRLLAE